MTTVRQGELLGLQWPNLYHDAGTMSIPWALAGVKCGIPMFGPPKTAHSRRTVTPPAVALAAPRAYRQRLIERRLLLGPDYADLDRVFATASGMPSNLPRIALPESWDLPIGFLRRERQFPRVGVR